MKHKNRLVIRDVALPWSDGYLSAKLWQVGNRIVVGVPELGLHCYGASQSQAVFRLFTVLIKYYRQLKSHRSKLNARGSEHLQLLSIWIAAIERRMTSGQSISVGSQRTLD